MKFTFDIQDPQRQYVQITAEIKVTKSETTLFLPAWRPGRYELGDFAKNINYFRVLDGNGTALKFDKQNKNTWLIQTEGVDKIVVKYSYYATELNAGSTYLDSTQLYVNPVNCCVFTEETYNDEITVQLNIPDDWQVAQSLEVKNKTFVAKGFDELADSPFICSADLQHETFEVKGVQFHIWMNGIVKPDWDRLIYDFIRFTNVQIDKFKGFPTDEYHYLIQILPYQAYHGVEHSKSTVITLGPSFAVFEEYYKELLGVSSHELYHTWNVKAIRPLDMLPYDFKKENYTKLGYIAEGVTTYMGDLMLLKGGVFSLEQYFDEMNAQLQKHYDNFGRFNYSVAASSFDTWLDGYVPGAPGRKISIYTEGCLLAFILDVYIMKHSNNEKSLDDLMAIMYHDYALKNIGVTEEIYQKEIEKMMETSMQWYFDDYINGTKDYTPLLEECFEYLGLEITTQATGSVFASYLGGKIEIDKFTKIVALYPDGPLDKAGAMLGDKIVSINGIDIEKNAERWARYFFDDAKTITVIRQGKLVELNLSVSTDVYYKRFMLQQRVDASENQLAALKVWSS